MPPHLLTRGKRAIEGARQPQRTCRVALPFGVSRQLVKRSAKLRVRAEPGHPTSQVLEGGWVRAFREVALLAGNYQVVDAVIAGVCPREEVIDVCSGRRLSEVEASIALNCE